MDALVDVVSTAALDSIVRLSSTLLLRLLGLKGVWQMSIIDVSGQGTSLAVHDLRDLWVREVATMRRRQW